MAIPNIFKRRQRRQILNTSVNDAFSTQRSNRDNSEVPSSIQLSQSEDESSARLNSSDEDAPTTSSTSKSNSDEDKPPTPLKKKGITDRFARDFRQGFKELGKELGDKGGKNIKEGMLVAGDKVGKNIKEGVKEAGEKAGDRVKDISDNFFALILIINFTWLGFFIWLNH